MSAVRLARTATAMAMGLVIPIAGAACGGSARDRASNGSGASDSMLRSAPTPLGTVLTGAAGDQSIVIHNTGNKVVLGLVRDTIYMGLSDSLLTSARTDMARERDSSGGLAGSFAGLIKKTVGNALGKRVSYPISDIQSVRYENGEIQFEYRNKHVLSFESISADNGKVLASFAPADAQRFVAAVNAALKRDDMTGQTP